jgi:hypothetical protein
MAEPDHKDSAAQGDPLDDPTEFLEQFTVYLRDHADATEVLIAAKWAAHLTRAVELGARRSRLDVLHRAFPLATQLGAQQLALWIEDAERLQAGRLVLP